MRLPNKNLIYLLAIIIISAIAGWYIYNQQLAADESAINSFDDCVAAGNPVMESYPEQCRTPGGKHFVNDIDRPISVAGEGICLPHKGDGPHTLECAFGIKSDEGENYQVGFEGEEALDFQVGGRYEIRGVFSPRPDSNYDILGSIKVATIEEL